MRKILSGVLLYGLLVVVMGVDSPVMAGDLTQRQRVILMLSGYERLPEPSAWHALGDSVVPTLIGIHEDPLEIGFRRVRALTVLGYFPADSRAAAFLADTIANTTTQGSGRRAAMAALSAVDPGRATGLLRSVLEESDPLMREAAVNALAQCGTSEARQILANHQDRESFVARAVQRAMAAE